MKYKFQVGDLVEVEPSLGDRGGLALITGRWHNPRHRRRHHSGNEYTVLLVIGEERKEYQELLTKVSK
jgi:hypothetical protein